jgi:hypothetical protein
MLFAAAAAGLAATSARADCALPGFNISGVFCNGCRYEGSMSLSRDEVCERAYRPVGPGTNPSVTPAQILSNRIVQRARHGIAGVSLNTLAYSPSKGFVGEDEFVVEAKYRQAQQTGTFTVHFRVTVR